jgi:hypothetical protein
MPILVDCPICSTKLELPEELLGKKVKCAKCGGIFEAQHSRTTSPPRDDDQYDPASPVPSSAPDMGERKIPCPRCGERIYADAKRCRFCGEDLENFEKDDRPWEPRQDHGEYPQPHRAKAIQTLGTLSMVCAGLVLCCGLLTSLTGLTCGITGWVMANRDLAKMSAGTMDPRGRRKTRNGRTHAIIGIILNIAVILLGVAFYVVYFTVLAPGLSRM